MSIKSDNKKKRNDKNHQYLIKMEYHYGPYRHQKENKGMLQTTPHT